VCSYRSFCTSVPACIVQYVMRLQKTTASMNDANLMVMLVDLNGFVSITSRISRFVLQESRTGTEMFLSLGQLCCLSWISRTSKEGRILFSAHCVRDSATQTPSGIWVSPSFDFLAMFRLVGQESVLSVTSFFPFPHFTFIPLVLVLLLCVVVMSVRCSRWYVHPSSFPVSHPTVPPISNNFQI
jgi:hypothetical protein